MDLILKLSGIFLGVLVRTLVPYLRKLRQGKVTSFHSGYLWSAAGSFVLGFIITLLIFPQFEAHSLGGGAEASVKLFSTAFGFGFGWNSIVSEAAKWAGAFKLPEEQPEKLTKKKIKPKAGHNS